MIKIAATHKHLYACTTTNHLKGLPELIVMSLHPKNARPLLLRATRRLEQGKLSPRQVIHDDLLRDYTVYIVPLEPCNLHLIPGATQALQIVLPDWQNVLPMMSYCQPFYKEIQPLLDREKYQPQI
jgi:hypothetical protein